MKILLPVLLFFALCSAVSAQGIMIYPKGEQQIMKLASVKTKREYINGFGKPCGSYFIYGDKQNQKVVSFVYLPTGKQEFAPGETPEHLVISKIEFQIDKTALFPTSEWFKARPPKMMLIRIPSKEYKAIRKCMPLPYLIST